MSIKDARKLFNGIIGISTIHPNRQTKPSRMGRLYRRGSHIPDQNQKELYGRRRIRTLEYAVKNVNIPFVAIGGIKEHNIQQVINLGARTVALVTEIVGSKNIPLKIKTLQAKFTN